MKPVRSDSRASEDLEMFLGPFMGYKVLNFKTNGEEQVVSPYRHSYKWWPARGPQAADCRLSDSRRGFGHESPDFDCGCGFHAYLEIEEAINCKALLRGHGRISFYFVVLVAGWGNVITHETGFRCQHMGVVAVHDGPYVYKDKIQMFATDLGVPFLKRSDLMDYSYEFGTVLTPETIPQ